MLTNPVAYRIVAALGTRGQQTTEGLAQILPDVPTSTLYRQLARLRAAGVLRVVGERQARGALELTYAVASRDAATIKPELLASAPVSQLRLALRNFVNAMVADVGAFIEARSFARFRNRLHAALYVAQMNDEDYVTAIGEIARAIREAKTRSESTGGPRSRRSFYLIAIPEDRP